MGKNKSWATIRWNVEPWVCYDFGYQHEDHLGTDEGARPSWQVAPTIAHPMPATRHHLHQHNISTRATLRIVPLANLTHVDCITFLEGPPILLGLQYQIKEEPLAWASTNTSIVHNAGIRSPGAQHQQRTCQQTGKKRSTHTIAREHVCVCACLWLCMCICVYV